MDRDGVAEDGGEPALARRVQRLLEHPAEDAQAAIGGVDDGGTRLGGADAWNRHHRVVPDHPPLVERDRGDQPARFERRHQVARPVEVGVDVAQVVALVEELGDRLGVLRCGRPHLDRIGRLRSRRTSPGGVRDVVAARALSAVRADGDLRRQTLPLGAEVQELHVSGVRREGGQRLGQRPEVASRTRQRHPPVVHHDVDVTVGRLERHLDLAEIVVRVRVLEREADEPLDDGAQSPRVVRGNRGRRRKGGEHGRHHRRRARVAQDGDLHPRHREAMLVGRRSRRRSVGRSGGL